MSSRLRRTTQYNLFHKSMLLNYEWRPRGLQEALLLFPPRRRCGRWLLNVQCASAEASLTATSALCNAYVVVMVFQI